MGEVRGSVRLIDNMTPALQSITNALNMTISHFEQMERVSRNSVDTSAFEAARTEIRNAEATIVEMQEALTGFSRNGAEVTRSFDEIGLAANSAGQTVSQAFQTTALQRMTEAIQQQTNEIMIMSEAIYQATNRTTESTRRQTEETRRQREERQRQTDETRRQTDETRRQRQQVGLLQRAYTRVVNSVQNVIQRHEVLQNTIQRLHTIQQRVYRIFHTMTTPLRSVAGTVTVLKQELTGANNSAGDLLGTLKRLVGVYLSLQGVNFVGKMSDNVTSVLSRLNMINDGLRSTKELSEVIMKAAYESGAGYLDTAEAIAKMGLNAGSAFQSNDELISFMEQINKTFAIGGASATEQSNAMIQLSQAMAAGALRGEELNSILDGAPGIARNIEKYMGWAEGSIKSYAEDGKVTADVVKNAMLSMAEETNEKFNSMPATIGRTFEKIKTLAIKSFTPVLQGINGLFNNSNVENILYDLGAVFQYIADRVTVTIEKLKNILNSEQFDAFAQDVMTIFASAGEIVTWFFDTAVNGISYVIENWDELRPVLTGIAAAIGVATAAQWGLNIAMSFNPVTLVIASIGALIVLFYKVVDRINKVKNTSISATGVIAGVFAGLYAVVKNVVVGVWNKFADVSNFVYNFSKNKADAIKVLFYELADDVLASFQNVVQGILSVTSHIPKLSFVTEGLERADNFLTRHRNHAKEMSQNIKNGMDWEEFVPKLEYTNVNEFVEQVYTKIAGFGEGFKDFMQDFDPFKNIESTNDILAGVLKNTQNMAKNTDKIADGLQRDKEDLEFLRTVANIKYGDKYVMPQVKIEMVNNNNINSKIDLDGFFDKKVDEIATIIQTSAEGVHI